MMRDVVSVLLVVLAFLLSPTPGITLECREDEVEWQGRCECKRCKDGFYGADCNKACSHNCVSMTNGPGACNRSSGHCLHGCKNGFFGLWCDAECSDHCVDRTCEGQFPEYGGTCVKGCKDGYRGVYCQVTCPDHCQTCSQRDMGCGQCQDGWYGFLCRERCQDCYGSCHKDTGKCTLHHLDTTPDPCATENHVIVLLSVFLGMNAAVSLLGLIVCVYKRRCRCLRKEQQTQDTEHAYESIGMPEHVYTSLANSRRR